MKHNNNLLLIKLYFVASVLNLILWIPIPEISHFMGASSLIYAFLFAVGSEQRIYSILALAWIPFYFANLTVWFIFAVKKQKIVPFLVVVGTDLIISVFVGFSKIHSGNSSDLNLAILGFVIRFVYYCGMIYSTIVRKHIEQGK